MPEISYLIKMLQDEDHNNRFEACEELRVSKPPLPQGAIDALIIATKDVDPDVADAARRALALHTSNPIWTPSVDTETPSTVNDKYYIENKTIKTSILLVLLVGALLFVYFNYWGLNPTDNPYYTRPTIFRASIIGIPFFPSGLLNLIPLFQGTPEAPDAGIGALLIGPFLWAIYAGLGGLYISSPKPRSYTFLGIFVLLLVLNISGCNGMGL